MTYYLNAVYLLIQSQGAYLAPPVLLFMNKHPMVAKYDLSSLRNILLGAAPVSPELIIDTRAKLRARGAKDLEITQVSLSQCAKHVWIIGSQW